MVICHSYVSLPEGKECLQSTYDHDPSKNASWHWQQLKTDTQHGFRPERSTSHSIYVIRRIQDFAEAKGTQLSLALLDGEKAFDKVQHDRLIFALKKWSSVNTIVISYHLRLFQGTYIITFFW